MKEYNVKDTSTMFPQIRLTNDDFNVEFEILNTNNSSNYQKEIDEIESKLNDNQIKLDELDLEIERLTNHADGLDYGVAVASGIIAGLIDSFWVGEFSIERANKNGAKMAEDFVKKIANKMGYEGDSLQGAVNALEEKAKFAADKVTNDFGGGKQHHLRDFSHHPTPIGLICSMITQFTGFVIGTDVTGCIKIVPLPENAFCLVGKNVPEKITFGFINWFFHLVSDMVGASGSIAKGSTGTGIPGPLVAFLKEMSALPIFKNMNEKGYKEFSVWVSKLFNGTLLGKRDANDKLIEGVKFDLRTEIGVGVEIGRQAIPVIINECIVRGFYFLRRLYVELKNSNIKSFADLKNLNWKNTLPFKNRTIVRMMTISTGTFFACDMIDAAIHSGGEPTQFLLRVNFVSVGRFVLAVGSDVKMGVDKNRATNERIRIYNEQIKLTNAKVAYKQADVWVEAESTGKTIEELALVAEQSIQYFAESMNAIDDSFSKIDTYIDGVKTHNSELVDEMLDVLKWG